MEKKAHTVKNTVICNKQQYVFFLSPTYEGKQHDKAMVEEDNLIFKRETKMILDLGYLGYNPPGLTAILPLKRKHKTSLSPQEKQHNTRHAKLRICNEHAIRGIKKLRIAQLPLRLCPYFWADKILQNACGIHNLRVRSPSRAYVRTGTHVTKLKFN